MLVTLLPRGLCFVRAPVVVRDAVAVAAVLSGKQQLSCGYAKRTLTKHRVYDGVPITTQSSAVSGTITLRLWTWAELARVAS